MATRSFEGERAAARKVGRDAGECVGSDRFAVEPRTPYLAAQAARLAGVLREALAGSAGIEVDEHAVVEAPGRFFLRPDLVVRGTGGPLLVVEVRRDSTDRFALGLKRLAYALAAIPAYWFVDPRAGVLRVMLRDTASGRYAWPERLLRAADEVAVPGGAGGPVAVARLLLPPGRLAAGTPSHERNALA